jgi:DNA-binding NarL/FixJ family response regulator
MSRPSSRRSKNIRVVIAENSLLASQSIARALKRCGDKFCVHALTGESSDALRAIQKYKPDVTLISFDLHDGPTAGLNVLHEIRASQIRTGPVMLTDTHDDEVVLRSFRSGARGVFCRSTPLKALSKCIVRTSEGQIWACTKHMQLLLDFITNLQPSYTPKKEGMTLLTRREQEVACLVAQGMSNQDIANQLKLREHTVRNYLFHIFEKLGLSSRVELTLYVLGQPAKHRDNPS